MSNPAYIRKILDISTAHVSENTSILLNEWAISCFVRPAIVYDKKDYGWLVYVPSEPGKETEPDFPEDLRSCIELARSHGCDWIMFDCDSTTIDELNVYEW